MIVRLKGPRSKPPEFAFARGKWFEIQVRSILEHAWAEIEHEVVYKSGMEFPGQFKRRFAAIAGLLEMIDKDFLMPCSG
jgi:ppGpp synthetase/RelA/SpoT-type nucleotidyltranferase